MTTFATAFRDYVTDGVPASGANPVSKSEARSAGLAAENGIVGVHHADIASASTLDLSGAAGQVVDVTGTTTVTAITLSDGNECLVRFTGALTLTNGASLILPSAANILTVAGDYAIFRGYAAGVVRCVIYSRADGKALIAPSSSTLVGYGQILNATIVESHSANAVTFALKTLAGADPSSGDPVKAYFRNATPGTGNYVERTITAALSITIPSGATVGFTSGIAGKLWLALVDDGGTPRIGVVNCLNGTSIYPLGQFPIVSSTVMNTSSDNAAVMYTDAAVTAKPYLILGYAEYSGANVIATAGTWANSPLRIHLQGQSDPLPGAILQQPNNSTGAVSTGTTVVPDDDTIPQNTEGDQYLSQAITPTSAANLLNVQTSMIFASSSGLEITMALFQDSTAGALASNRCRLNTTGQPTNSGLIDWPLVAGTISSTTLKVRAGAGSAGTLSLNGAGGSRKLGGSLNSFIKVLEIMA